MVTQVIITLDLLLIIGMTFVDSAPIDSRSGIRCSDPLATVTMPKWIGEILTDVSDTALGLYSVYKNTGLVATYAVDSPLNNASVRLVVMYVRMRKHLHGFIIIVPVPGAKCLYGSSVHTQLFYDDYIQSDLFSAH